MKHILILLLLCTTVFGAWDNDKPADNRVWNLAAGDIRANNDALEAAFGVDLVEAQNGIIPAINVKNPAFGAVGDGITDDTSAINTAIASATTGGIVIFPSGTYLISSVLTVAVDGIIVKGSGNKTIIKMDANADSNTFDITGDNVTVLDFKIDGNKANQTSGSTGVGVKCEGDGFRIKNVWCADIQNLGIFLKTCSDAVVENCRITDVGGAGLNVNNEGFGISANSVIGFKLINNRITDPLSNGISIKDDSVTGCEDFIIQHNYISGLITTDRSGIGITDGEHGLISNNIMVDFLAGNAMRFVTVGSVDLDVVVTGNYIRDVTGAGFEIGANGVAITGNVAVTSIAGANGVGVFVSADDVIINGNHLEGFEHGVFIGAAVDHVIVSSNVIKNSDSAGIRIPGDADGSTNINISNNLVYDDQSSPSQDYGLWITSTSLTDVTVHGNIYGPGHVIADTLGLDVIESSLVEFNTGAKFVGTKARGGLSIRFQDKTISALTGATDDFGLAVPSGAKIIGCQIIVDTIIVIGGGGTTWSAAYITGATQSIATAQSTAKNTKVNKFFDVNTNTDITTDVTDIRLTPNAGTFTSGIVRAIIYYEELVAMEDL